MQSERKQKSADPKPQPHILKDEDGHYSIPNEDDGAKLEEYAEQDTTDDARLRRRRWRKEDRRVGGLKRSNLSNKSGGYQSFERTQLEKVSLTQPAVRPDGAIRHHGEDQSRKYDLIFDDTIDFVTARKALTHRDLLPNDDEEEQVTESESNHRKEPTSSRETVDSKAAGSIRKLRQSLPVFAHREQILNTIEQNTVTVLVGETGSGKTTQIPQYLYEAGYCKGGGMIGVTQPRRVAAMSVAKRVSEEMDVALGQEVGYSIRFEDMTSKKTRLKYMTDGMLLREMINDGNLERYSVIVIDEAHERTLHTDILFGLLRDLCRARADTGVPLKLIIASATLDAQRFAEFFNNAPIVTVPGRMYPVDIFYTKQPEPDYVEAAIVAVLQIHLTQPMPGDILVFLTGQDEIEGVMDGLETRMAAILPKDDEGKLPPLCTLPIYASLPPEQQARIFRPPEPKTARKCILATNIAETSLTIDGIVFVVDTGLAKQSNYNARSGMDSLLVEPISQASANQRAGRAGRVQAGKCFRLYTQQSFEADLLKATVPEIQRTNLRNVVLMLKMLGVDDLLNFGFMDPPPAETLIRALEELYALGALASNGQLTHLGTRMAALPFDPQLSRSIFAAEEYGCLDEMLTVAAMLSVSSGSGGSGPFYRPRGRKLEADQAHRQLHDPRGDHLTLFNAYHEWEGSGYSSNWCYAHFIHHRIMKRARDVRDQLEDLCERHGMAMSSVKLDDEDPRGKTRLEDYTVPIRKALVAGYFYHTARIGSGGGYEALRALQSPSSGGSSGSGQVTVYIHPSSSLASKPPRMVIYHELVLTKKEYMRQIVAIEPAWLQELVPHFYSVDEVSEMTKHKKKMPKAMHRC
eukprot:Clim_evm108s109 gene=Clim_evmTU108s109